MSDYKIDRHKFFDKDERRSILTYAETKAAEDKQHGRTTWIVRWMLVDLAMYTGLRVSEIAALKLKDIDLKAADPYIRVREGKGAKDRDVYLRDQLTEHLRKFIDSKGERNESTASDAPLFSGRSGHYTPTALTISFKKAVRQTPGLRDDLSIHSARHTYATFLYSDTKNLRFVQQQLGHSDISMTQLYVGILPEENGRLANMIS